MEESCLLHKNLNKVKTFQISEVKEVHQVVNIEENPNYIMVLKIYSFNYKWLYE